MSTVYLNGQYLPLCDAKISVLDRGFLFGDGIYEVIPVYQGALFRLEDHLQRLSRSLAAARIQAPLDDPSLVEMFEQLVHYNGAGNLSIYLQISRGADSKREHNINPQVPASLFAMTHPMAIPKTDQLDQAEGVSVISRPDPRWLRCDIKSTALFANILMRQEALDAGAYETILLREGWLTEAAAANVFIVKDNQIITPPLDHQILGGITRQLILELAEQAGLSTLERPVSETELRQADEIWLSSATKELVPVTELDGKSVGQGSIGPLWPVLARRYIDYKRKLCGLDLQQHIAV